MPSSKWYLSDHLFKILIHYTSMHQSLLWSIHILIIQPYITDLLRLIEYTNALIETLRYIMELDLELTRKNKTKFIALSVYI